MAYKKRKRKSYKKKAQGRKQAASMERDEHGRFVKKKSENPTKSQSGSIQSQIITQPIERTTPQTKRQPPKPPSAVDLAFSDAAKRMHQNENAGEIKPRPKRRKRRRKYD